MQDFLKNILANLLSAPLVALLMLIGGVVVAWINLKMPRWRETTMVALKGAALIGLCLVPLLIVDRFPRHQPPTTPENAESRIRAWLDNLGLAVKKNPNPQTYFALIATVNDRPIGIFRAKASDRYVTIACTVMLTTEQQAAIAKLSHDQADHVTRRLSLELARSRIGFTLTDETSLKTAVLTKAILIASLSEDSLIERLDEVDSAIVLSREVIAESLRPIKVAP